MNNLEIYEKYKKVPGNALKPFDNGRFKGTDINTMWRIKCLTEAFGPVGIGWIPEIIREWSEPADKEVLCFVEIKLYIKFNNEWSKGISAIGGSRIVKYFKSKDYAQGDDEGYKMAATDALGVACKYLGFGADVYWENDKTKYTDAEDKKETLPEQKPQKETLKPVAYVDDEMAADIFARAQKKGFDENTVMKVIKKDYAADDIFLLTIAQGNELIKRIEAK